MRKQAFFIGNNNFREWACLNLPGITREKGEAIEKMGHKSTELVRPLDKLAGLPGASSTSFARIALRREEVR